MTPSPLCLRLFILLPLILHLALVLLLSLLSTNAKNAKSEQKAIQKIGVI